MYLSWTGVADIIAVANGSHHAVGLTSGGMVIAMGNNKFGQCDVSGWRDITAISAGPDHTAGLKKDGTVVAVGDHRYCSVSDWTGIIAISAGYDCTVGLQANGTVVGLIEANVHVAGPTLWPLPLGITMP